MLNCNNCVFGKKVPGSSHHMACSRIGVKLANVNEHGVKNGWFSFPFNFDVIWAESCDGFIPTDWEDFSIEERSVILVLEIKKIEDEKFFFSRNKEFFKDNKIISTVKKEPLPLSSEECSKNIGYIIDSYRQGVVGL
jgi:hypothetical protein